MPRWSRRHTFRAAAALAALSTGLLLVEGTLRLKGVRPFVDIHAATPDATLWIRDPALGWRNRPGFVFDNVLTGSRVTTGPRGERLGLRWTQDPARPLVLFVGDSTTFCGEVDDEKTGPSEVARRLPDLLDVSVVNAGVRGYSTLQALRNARAWLDRARVRLVVYTYCDNDYVENLVPNVNAPAIAPTARLREGDRLDQVELPASYGPPWDVPVGADPPPPPPEFGRDLLRAVEARSALVTALRDRFERPPAGAGIQRWAGAIRWADEHRGAEVLTRLLGDLRDACAARGARLLVTRFVTASERARADLGPLDTQEKLEKACAANGVELVDLRPAFSLEEDRYVTHLATGRRDAHYGPLGTATYGEALAPYVVRALEAGR